jgi:hypothetical protein
MTTHRYGNGKGAPLSAGRVVAPLRTDPPRQRMRPFPWGTGSTSTASVASQDVRRQGGASSCISGGSPHREQTLCLRSPRADESEARDATGARAVDSHYRQPLPVKTLRTDTRRQSTGPQGLDLAWHRGRQGVVGCCNTAQRLPLLLTAWLPRTDTQSNGRTRRLDHSRPMRPPVCAGFDTADRR